MHSGAKKHSGGNLKKRRKIQQQTTPNNTNSSNNRREQPQLNPIHGGDPARKRRRRHSCENSDYKPSRMEKDTTTQLQPSPTRDRPKGKCGAPTSQTGRRRRYNPHQMAAFHWTLAADGKQKGSRDETKRKGRRRNEKKRKNRGNRRERGIEEKRDQGPRARAAAARRPLRQP